MSGTPTSDPPTAHGDAPGVVVSHLRASYDRHVFTDVSFTVPAGTTTVVSGPSGIGKSTLVRVLLGQQAPDRGEINIGGRSLIGTSRTELADVHRHTGFLFSGLDAGARGRKGLDPTDGLEADPSDGVEKSATVGDNVRRALTGRQASDRDDDRVRRTLTAFDLVDDEHRRAGELGAGAWRRLALARVFVTGPTLVLLDDPVASLEPADRDAVVAGIARMRADGAAGRPTIVIACFDLTTVRELGDQLVPLISGRVRVAGPPAELLDGIETDYDFAARFSVGGKTFEKDSKEALDEHQYGAGLITFDQRVFITSIAVLGVLFLLAVAAVVVLHLL